MHTKGVHHLSLDIRGRFSVPPQLRYRFEASPEVVMTVAPDRCALALYALDEWEKVISKLDGISMIDKTSFHRKRRVIGYAVELDISHNRLIIPLTLIKYAGLNKNIVVIAEDTQITLLSLEEFEKHAEL